MTGIVCYTACREVHLFTDRALYTQDGIVRGFATKVAQIHDHPVVVTARGNFGIQSQIIGELLACTAPQSILASDQVLDAIAAHFRGFVADRGEAQAEFLIASVIGGKGATHFVPLNGQYPDMANFDMNELPSAPDPSGYSFVNLGPDVQLPARHSMLNGLPDFVDYGCEVMQYMRRAKAPSFDLLRAGRMTGHEIHGIGGGVDHTAIRTAGVSMKRVLNWSDAVGEQITPTN